MLSTEDILVDQLTTELKAISSKVMLKQQRLEAMKEKLALITAMENEIQDLSVLDQKLHSEMLETSKEITKHIHII